MERRPAEPKPGWEMVDPKPPVIRCGHLEDRNAQSSDTLTPGDISG